MRQAPDSEPQTMNKAFHPLRSGLVTKLAQDTPVPSEPTVRSMFGIP